MGYIPSGYLKQPGRVWVRLTRAQRAVLIDHVVRGAAEEDIGYEDAADTMQALVYHLRSSIVINPSSLESALWSCNLMNEAGRWEHPTGQTFDAFVKAVIGPGARFDRTYNMIIKKGDI